MALTTFEVKQICIEHLREFLIKRKWKNIHWDNNRTDIALINADGTNGSNTVIIVKCALAPDKPESLIDEERNEVSVIAYPSAIARVAYITIDEDKNLVGEIDIHAFG